MAARRSVHFGRGPISSAGVPLNACFVALFLSLAMLGCTQTPDVVARLRSEGVGVGLGEDAAAQGEASSEATHTNDNGESTEPVNSGESGESSNPVTGGTTSEDGVGGEPVRLDSGLVESVRALDLSGELEAHDPSLVQAPDGRYYLFHTGDGIPYKVSEDLKSWRAAGRVFAENPPWIAENVPEATGLWAPDVAWVQDRYHLYYAASTFGSGQSCIGHATTDSLDGTSPSWEDHGPVICSDVNGSDDDWDAIDPSQLTDRDKQRWMVFGSFGSGIHLIPLDEQGQRRDTEQFNLARRPEAPHAIQAPFLLHRQPYYYLFVSFDWCCRGVSSTHHIRVGRSESLLGPYFDKAGVSMLEGGGTVVLEGNDRWRAAGASSLSTINEQDYVTYHAYDANAVGRATLRIAEVAWDDEGWPVFGGP